MNPESREGGVVVSAHARPRAVRGVLPLPIRVFSIQSLLRAGAPVGAVVAIAVLFLPLTPAYDLDVFLRAGHAALHSGQVYPLGGTPAVYSGFSFVYPYFAVWPFVPLAAMSSGLSTVLFFVGSSCAVIAGCVVASDRDLWTAALVLCTAFTITGLQLGALSPLLFAGTVFLWRLRARPVSFGLVAAPVVASKLFLVPLLAWPLLARRYRAFAWALVTTIALLAAGFVFGPLSLPQYVRLLSQLGAHEARAGFGLIGALRNAGLPPVWAQTAALALASTLFAGAYAHYRGSADERILFCAGIVGSLILTPVLWSHYLVLLPAALLALDAPRRWFVVLALASWLIAPPHGTHLQIPVPERLKASGPWLTLAASLCVFAYAARQGRREPHGRDARPRRTTLSRNVSRIASILVTRLGERTDWSDHRPPAASHRFPLNLRINRDRCRRPDGPGGRARDWPPGRSSGATRGRVPRYGRRVLTGAFLLLVLSTPAWEDASESTASTPIALVALAGGAAPGAPIPAGFLGLSLEFTAVRAYTGRDATAINPVLVQLIRNLAPGQTPVLRIGGDSTDWTWWPVRGVARPASVSYRLTPGWLRTTGALARVLGARMILGINLAMNRPTLAATEARALIAGVGRPSVAALEIGNEGDVYTQFPVYRDPSGRVAHVRALSYNFGAFTQEFSTVRRALPSVPTAGPTFGGLRWMSRLGPFLTAERGLGLVTFHRYPLSCFAPQGSPDYPTIPNLLSDQASHGLAQTVAPFVAIAHAQRVPFRVDELNSVACAGVHGVSDTFASALWALDTLFELARLGVDGVNLHTLPGASYQPFTFTHRGGSWDAFVDPEYYGLLMFAQATPPGSRLLPVNSTAGGQIKLWATLAPDQTIRFVLINKGTSSTHVVLLQPPGSAGRGTLERLTAPSLAVTNRVTLGGQSFGPITHTGTLSGRPGATTIHALFGMYAMTLPPASATMLTLCAPSCGPRLPQSRAAIGNETQPPG